MRRFIARLLNVFGWRGAEREMAREINSHLALLQEDYERRGLPPEEARLAARRAYGSVESVKELQREARSFVWIEQLFRDVRFGGRNLLRSPGFATLAVLVAALGIGANTAVFSVVDAVLLKPLAFRDADRIVTLTSVWRSTGRYLPQVALPDFADWRAGSKAFLSMAYYRRSQRPVALGGSAHYARVARVSPDFFRVLAVAPVMGRIFSANDADGTHNIAVISYSYWLNRLGGSSDILNHTLRVDGDAFAIVGVSPPGFSFPDATEIWQMSDVVNRENSEPRSSLSYLVIARLKSDVDIDQARAQLTAVSRRLEQQYPNSNHDRSVAVSRLRDDMTGDVRPTLIILLGAVGSVLLIACSNIATLLLARATARTHEIAMRTALGAGRGRIVRQLLAECLLLAILGGAIGCAPAFSGSRALVALAPADIPRLSEAGVDGRVLAFTLVISGVASLLFGMAPAMYASRVDVNEALKQGVTRTVTAGRTGRMRQALVIGQIALSIMLLTGAGLFIRSFAALNSVDLGFRPKGVLVMETSVPARPEQAARFFRELVAETSTTPGVVAAGAIMGIPGHVESAGSYWIDHYPKVATISPFDAVYSVVTPGVFAAMQVPINRGRDFNDDDRADRPLTAIINEALAKKAFRGQDPVGRTIFAGFDSEKPMTIVGVVGNMVQWGVAAPSGPEIFMPYEQHTDGAGTALRVVVRSTAFPEAFEDLLRRKVRALSADVPVRFTTMEKSLYDDVGVPRFRTLLIACFACIALCLAMAGVYGVLAYSAGRRTNEIGLRMALGANTRTILWMIGRQGLTLAGVGIALGVAASIATTHFLTSMLFQVNPNDPATYFGVILSLGIITVFACCIPASRAVRVNPLEALRQE